MAEVESLKKYTASQLKQWLTKLNKKTTGNKSELLLRLMSIPENERGELPTQDTENNNDADVHNLTSQTMDEQSDEHVDDYYDSNTTDADREDADIVDNEMGKKKTKKYENNEKETITSANAIAMKSAATTRDGDKKWSMMKREIDILKREMEIQKRENELLKFENECLRSKQRNDESDNNTSVQQNFVVMKELLAEFTGEGDYFTHWESQLNNIKDAYNLDEKNMKLLISCRLKGNALKWFHSRSDVTITPVEVLLREMKMFADHTSRLSLKRKLEARKWLLLKTYISNSTQK